VDTSDQLKKESLFDLLMAVNCREERFCYIVIKSIIFSHFFNDVHLVLSEVRINLVPNDVLIEDLFLCIFIFFFILFLLEELVKLIIFDFDVDGSKNKFIAQVSDTFQARNASFHVAHTSGFNTSGSQLGLFSWFQHA